MNNLEHPIEVKIGYCAFFSQKKHKKSRFLESDILFKVYCLSSGSCLESRNGGTEKWDLGFFCQ